MLQIGDLHIQSTAFAIRNSIANSTKITAAELVLGTKLQQPVDKFISTPAKVTDLPFAKRQASQFAQSLVKQLVDSNNVVQSNLIKHRDDMKHQYDRGVQGRNVSIGDQVMLWSPYKKSKLSRCFQPNWTGPWTVHDFTGPSNCKLISNNGQYKNVHINQLKFVETRHVKSEPLFNKVDKVDQQATIDRHCDENKQIDLIEILDTMDEADHIRTLNGDIIGRNWVELDQTNILPHRTRGRRDA